MCKSRKKNMVWQKLNCKGEQSGEYFGAALANLDIDGDGLDELIVGSPLFTPPTQSSNSWFMLFQSSSPNIAV